jgi:hypothetical protein
MNSTPTYFDHHLSCVIMRSWIQCCPGISYRQETFQEEEIGRSCLDAMSTAQLDSFESHEWRLGHCYCKLKSKADL